MTVGFSDIKMSRLWDFSALHFVEKTIGCQAEPVEAQTKDSPSTRSG